MFSDSLTALKQSVNMGTPTMISASRSSIGSGAGLPAGSKKAPFPKSDIKVNLSDHYSSKVYTSSSPVSGNVTITTKRDVRFDAIQIILLGTTRTSFENMGAPHNVTHTFLKMIMPVPESTYPSARVLQSGQTYTIPFNFVIPNQLTINACNHERLSDQVQDHHVLLPPTMGGWQRDDMSPMMARVSYTVTARVVRDDVIEGVAKRTRIMEATQDIQVLPASPEEPPLNITDKDTLYRMSKTKTMRKNLLSTKLGRLTAEAVQPGAAVLSADGRRVMSHPMVHINLTYEPESSSSSSASAIPPTITSVSSKITAHTYFSSGTIAAFPNLADWSRQPYVLDRRGQFFTSASLPAVTLAEQPAWATPVVRRDSGYGSSDSESTDTEAQPQTSKKSKTKKTKSLTTTLAIPLTLPTDKKTFLPTFHSCIASRVYTLHLSLQLSVRGAANSISLVVPLQVAVEGFGAGTELQLEGGMGMVPPSFEEAAADEHLRPRVLRMPVEGEGGGGFVTGGSAVGVMGPGYGEGGDGDELPGYGSLR